VSSLLQHRFTSLCLVLCWLCWELISIYCRLINICTVVACVGSENHWDHKICYEFNSTNWNDASTASEPLWVTRLLNVLLASGVNVHRLHSCWRRTFRETLIANRVCRYSIFQLGLIISELTHALPKVKSRWDGQNCNHLCQVSSQCCLPEIIIARNYCNQPVFQLTVKK